MNLFAIQKRSNNEKCEIFFQNQAESIKNIVRLYYGEKNTIEKYISRFEVHTILKNHKENKASCVKIDALVTKWIFSRFTDDFINNLSEEFDNSFSVKTAEAADLIINSIDSWYVVNHLDIPTKETSATNNSVSVTIDTNYFIYNEIVGMNQVDRKEII